METFVCCIFGGRGGVLIRAYDEETMFIGAFAESLVSLV